MTSYKAMFKALVLTTLFATTVHGADYRELIADDGSDIEAVIIRDADTIDDLDDRAVMLITQKKMSAMIGSASATSPNDHVDDDVESVTGTAVNVSDPRNVVIDLVPAPIQSVTGTAVTGTATDPVIDVSANDHVDDDVESVTGTAVDVTDPRNVVIDTDPNSHVDDDVETVTGTAVDVTDPRNPVIDLVPAPLQSVTGTAVSGTAADPVIDHGSIDNATDVDTTSTAPAANDVLVWDGTNWGPQALSAGHADDDVESVTGTAVDVTDPRNPVIDWAVSADAGNDIVLGTDGALLYQAPTELVSPLAAQRIQLDANGLPIYQRQIEKLVLRQDLNAGGLFANNAEADSFAADSADPASEPKYSIMSELEEFRRRNGKIRFKLVYDDFVVGTGPFEEIWEQSSNPLQTVGEQVVGYELISTTDPYPEFRGLALSNSTSARFDGTAGTDWWRALGLSTAFTGNTFPVNETALSTARIVELYALVDENESSVDVCGINEYTNNVRTYYAAYAHEGAGGTNVTMSINGVGATYTDITNGSDAGGGLLTLSGGANGNYNRRGRTVEGLLAPGDYFEIVKPATGQFDTQQLIITANAGDLANTATNVYRIVFNQSTGSLRAKDNSVIYAAGPENATYRITRTLAGFQFEKNGLLMYETQCGDPVNYSGTSPVTTHVFDGLQVDAAPAWDNDGNGPLLVPQTTGVTQAFGVDLNNVDRLVLHYRVSNDTWPIRREIEIEHIVRDVDQGYMLPWFNDDYIALRLNTADVATGTIRFISVSNTFELLEVEFKKDAVGVSRRLGEMVHMKSTRFASDAAAIAQGYMPVKPGTIVDGALDYPLWAAMHTEYVSGDDIVFPADVDGMFLRNLGGNAANEGVYQVDENKAHTHTVTDVNHPDFTNNGNGANVARRSSASTTRTTSSNGGVESRPVNRAYQLYTIIDSYVELPATPPVVDTLPLFTGGAAAKTEFLTVSAPDSRPYTVIADDAATTEVIERAYDGAKYPFVEIEVDKDATAVAGVYLRANSTGGRQSQMRLSVVSAVTDVANSGANTALPIVHRELETEYTIRYLVEFTETGGNEHTELEIAPAGTNLDLTIDATTPPLQQSIGIVGVTLYGSDPR